MYKVYATLSNGQKHFISKHTSLNRASASAKDIQGISCWDSVEILRVESGKCKGVVKTWTR